MTIAFSRRLLFAVLSLWLGVFSSVGQDTDVLIAAGRFYLTKHEPLRASGLFQQAAESSPTNHEANALSALARLTALPYRPAISNFLNRLNVPVAGRDIYNWTAQFPKTPDGKLSIPSFLKTTEVAELFRSELLDQIGLSLQELSRITNTAFLLNLSKEETTTTNVVVDVADLRLCTALLEGVKVGLLSFYPWEFDAPLSELASLSQGGSITVEEFTRRYPTLYATIQASDGSTGRAGFLAGVEAYNQAIALIQQRPANVVRLFNLGPDDKPDEQQFRVGLNELKASLTQPTVLSIETNLTVSLGEFFSAKAPLRSFLPELVGNGIVSGSWPDTNFGGILLGAALAGLEDRYPPEYIHQVGAYRSSSYPIGIHVVGPRAFVANAEAGLLVLDISNPSQPTRVGSLATSGQARAIQVVGNIAYVAHLSSGLQIFDVTNPSAPVRLGGYDTPGQGLAVAVSGTIAAIADGNRGLQLVDISNPTAPVLLGAYDTPGNAEDVQIVGSRAFVADGSGGLQIIGISDPAKPSAIGQLQPREGVNAVEIQGNLAFLGNYAGLLIVDVTDPAFPKPKGAYAVQGSARGLEVVGNYVLLIGGDRLAVIDFSDPALPRLVSRYMSSWGVNGGDVNGDYAYLINGNGLTVEILDVSMFTAPPSPPIIQTEPQDLETIEGQTVSFAVTASGTKPLFFQWLRDGKPIPDATSAILTLTNVTPDLSGIYSVSVSNSAGSDSSSGALLFVAPLPVSPSKLRLLPTAGTNWKLDVTSLKPGRIYVLQVRDQLDGNWDTVSEVVGPETGRALVSIQADGLRSRFWRIVPKP